MQFAYYNSGKKKIILTNNTLVPVIASFDCDGTCTPLYFRYTYADDSSESVKIDKIVFRKPNSCFGTIFCCQVTVSDCSQTIYLFYHDEERKWYLRDHS